MKRLKQAITGKDKGKGVETSSTRTYKRRNLVINDEDDEERQPEQETEEMEEDEDQSPDRPEWKVGTSLHTLPQDWQAMLYKEKLGEVDSLKKQLVGERRTNVEEFRGFGMIEAFERMGWQTGLVWNNDNNQKVYMDGIVEWMATLERTLGNNPPVSTKFIGTVNGKKVVMSFATLDKIAKFDAGDGPFTYLREEVLSGSAKGDNWDAMIEELFTFTPEQRSMNVKLEKYFLKPLPRLMMMVLNWNVCPRTSDRTMVRYNEVVILHALVTGRFNLSMRQIIMANIWEARNRRNKTILPHCRLITSLIKNQKATPRDIMMVELVQTPISLARLPRGHEWRFEDHPVARILKDAEGNRDVIIAPKEGYTREQAIAILEERDRGEARVQERVPRVNVGNAGARVQREIPRVNLERPEFYDQWSPFEKQMWDMTANQAEVTRIQAEEARARYEEQRRFEHGMVYAHELDIRRRFEYDERVRHHRDYVEGLPFIEEPPQYNYQTLKDYHPDVDSPPHYPRSYDSDWLPRHSCVARVGEGSSSAPPPPPDPFETQSMYTGLMESIFGPRPPP